MDAHSHSHAVIINRFWPFLTYPHIAFLNFGLQYGWKGNTLLKPTRGCLSSVCYIFPLLQSKSIFSLITTPKTIDKQNPTNFAAIHPPLTSVYVVNRRINNPQSHPIGGKQPKWFTMVCHIIIHKNHPGPSAAPSSRPTLSSRRPLWHWRHPVQVRWPSATMTPPGNPKKSRWTREIH